MREKICALLVIFSVAGLGFWAGAGITQPGFNTIRSRHQEDTTIILGYTPDLAQPVATYSRGKLRVVSFRNRDEYETAVTSFGHYGEGVVRLIQWEKIKEGSHCPSPEPRHAERRKP